MDFYAFIIFLILRFFAEAKIESNNKFNCALGTNNAFFCLRPKPIIVPSYLSQTRNLVARTMQDNDNISYGSHADGDIDSPSTAPWCLYNVLDLR